MTNGNLEAGISKRFGPVQDKDEEMKDADAPIMAKRKSRTSVQAKSYAEAESSEEDQPLVRSYSCSNDRGPRNRCQLWLP